MPGAQGPQGATGPAGADGQNGQDLYAVALGCVSANGTAQNGYGFSVVQVVNGTYRVLFSGYDFPSGFTANDLIVFVSDDAITQWDVTPFMDDRGVGFEIAFKNLWFEAINVDWCFRAYDGSQDPYATGQP